MLDTAKDILRMSNFFKHLSSAEIDALCVDANYIDYHANDIIIKEGEIGSLFYIIFSGSVQVYSHNLKDEKIVLARLEKGNYFGEQALLTSIPTRCNATVCALTPVTVLTFTHAVLQNCLKMNKSLSDLLQTHGHQQLIAKLAAQLQIDQTEKKELLSLVKEAKEYSPREVIFRQGSQADYAYYLLSGSIEIRIYDEELKLKLRKVILPGQFFGELGVLQHSRRAGTAVVLDKVNVIAIDAGTLQKIVEENSHLYALLSNLMRMYDIPMRGFMTQFQGEFLGHVATETQIKKPNGDTLIASRLLHADVVAICYAGQKNVTNLFFKTSDQHAREIQLVDQHLVGVISTGEWDDLAIVYQLVYEKPLLTPELLNVFEQSGKLEAKIQRVPESDITCACMNVKFEVIQKMILEGATTLEQISKSTGAGTVCGGCRPVIKEMLGIEAFTYVKLCEIKAHHQFRRSFQFRPLNKEIMPYEAGQYIVIEAEIEGRWIARSYTLTSIYGVNNFYEITVKREPLGLFSRWLFDNARLGTILKISEPQGNFIFHPDRALPAICLVGGIGATPAIAFAKKLIQAGAKRRLYIDYSETEEDAMIFKDDMADWLKHHKDMSIKIRVTSKHPRMTSQDVQEMVRLYPDAEFFICGCTAFQHAVVNLVKAAGISDSQINVEEFTHAGEPSIIA
jgi:ferredoxin-NADP reductase/CRP-like cAMP-binding protein